MELEERINTMTGSLKAIETEYNGYKFRSRLEARWAVFFDVCGIEYNYEAEGYDLDGTYYLPDFWLPKQKYFIEIKGKQPDGDEEQKASLLNQISGHQVFIFFGEINNTDGTNDSGYMYDQGWDNCQQWHICNKCNLAEIHYSYHSERLSCHCKAGSNDKVLEDGYLKARQARFEYGSRKDKYFPSIYLRNFTLKIPDDLGKEAKIKKAMDIFNARTLD